jgi:hypothetical protein
MKAFERSEPREEWGYPPGTVDLKVNLTLLSKLTCYSKRQMKAFERSESGGSGTVDLKVNLTLLSIGDFTHPP